MQQEEINHYLRLALKTAVGVMIYFVFLIYTPTIYGMAQTLIQNTFFESRVIIVGHSAIKVQIADSIQERTQGLSGTERLDDGHGLFFIFDTEDRHGIWMKDMNYSIDIIWFDRFGQIIHIEENVSPDTYPKVFRPESAALYVLEVNAGFVDQENLMMGDSIDLY